MKILGLALPGLWHILHDRCWTGLGLFAGFASGVNGFVVWPLAFGPHGSGWRFALLAVAVAAWLFSTVAMFRRSGPELLKSSVPPPP